MVKFSADIIEFKADINAYQKAIKRTYVTAFKRAAMYLSNQIIGNSPHDTGKFIASNKIAINYVNDDTYNGPNVPKTGAKQIAKGEQQKIKSINQRLIDKGVTIWFSNNVPYNLMIEYGLYNPSGPKITGNGYSKKSPKGVYRLAGQSTEIRMQEIIKQAEVTNKP